jgi:hypothetical protein
MDGSWLGMLSANPEIVAWPITEVSTLASVEDIKLDGGITTARLASRDVERIGPTSEIVFVIDGETFGCKRPYASSLL